MELAYQGTALYYELVNLYKFPYSSTIDTHEHNDRGPYYGFGIEYETIYGATVIQD